MFIHLRTLQMSLFRRNKRCIANDCETFRRLSPDKDRLHEKHPVELPETSLVPTLPDDGRSLVHTVRIFLDQPCSTCPLRNVSSEVRTDPTMHRVQTHCAAVIIIKGSSQAVTQNVATSFLPYPICPATACSSSSEEFQNHLLWSSQAPPEEPPHDADPPP